MKALQLHATNDLRLVDVAKLPIAPNEMLVRTGAALICTSDVADLRRNPFGLRFPVVMGHEGSGTVAEVGSSVKAFSPGDRVAAHPVHPCGRCTVCEKSLGHLCEDMRHFGINMPGTFAEYFVVREDRAREIRDDLSFAVAALAEPVAVCLEALEQARIKPNDDLLIFGDGPFGIILARLASALYLAETTVAGRHDARLKRVDGWASAVNLKGISDSAAALRERCPAGFDAVILAVASPSAVSAGVSLLKPRGRFVVFSAIPDPVPLDLFRLHVKELEIIGSCNDKDKLDPAVPLLSDPRLSLSDLITHRLPLADFQRAFALAESSRDEALKVAFTFDGEPAQ
jgi:2-desacetyl-2-hydroxyethyl bacteriochlorophyllide A dehydrogenase